MVFVTRPHRTGLMWAGKSGDERGITLITLRPNSFIFKLHDTYPIWRPMHEQHHWTWRVVYSSRGCSNNFFVFKPRTILENVEVGQWMFVITLHAWWRHQMETFSALLALCAGNSPVTGEFPSQRSVTRSFDVFFDLRLNKRLSKHSWGWCLETPLRSLWRHCDGLIILWVRANTMSQHISSPACKWCCEHIQTETKWSPLCRAHFKMKTVVFSIKFNYI